MASLRSLGQTTHLGPPCHNLISRRLLSLSHLGETHLGTSSSDANGSWASSGIPGGGAGGGGGSSSSSSSSVMVEPMPSASSNTPRSFAFVFFCPFGCVWWFVWVGGCQRKRPASYQATYLQTHTTKVVLTNVELKVCC